MKILLIDPPFQRFTGFARLYYPIGLGYIAAAARKAGHDVLIADIDVLKRGNDIDYSDEYRRLELYRQGINDSNHPVWQEIINILDDFQPDLVGITIMTTKFGSALKTAEIVKKWKPRMPIIAGGPHATLLPDQVLDCKNLDFIVRDEGETTFVELIEAIEKKSDLENISGISYKVNSEKFHNAPKPYIENLDELEFPARDLLLKPENYSSEDMGVIMTSRGCPFNCSYCCHMWQRKVRNRSVDNILDEIRYVLENYNTRQIEFKDDSFTLNKPRIMELCQKLLDQKIKINWSCSTRVNLLDEELIIAMKKSGCNVVKLGIETGSEQILLDTDKGVTFDQMRSAAKLLNKHKIFWSGYFMMGLPNETETDIRKTLSFMKEINPYYAGIGVYNPFPKTKLFEQGVEMGLLHKKVSLEHFFKTNPKDYFFINPDKRVKHIKKKKFKNLGTEISSEFHKHNTQLSNLIRRGWSRRFAYRNDFKLLLADIKKAFHWKFN